MSTSSSHELRTKYNTALTKANVSKVTDSIVDLNCLAPASETISVTFSHLSRVGSQKVLEGLIRNRKDWKVENGRIASASGDTQSLSGLTSPSDGPKSALGRVAQRTNSFLTPSGSSTFGEGTSTSKRTSLETILADAAAMQSKVKENAFFDGKTFLLLGEANAPQVASTIRRFGGVVVYGDLESGELDVDFVIVRLAR